MLELIQSALANANVGGVGLLELAQAVVAFIGAASVLGAIVAKMTKTQKDDAFFAKVRNLILKVSLNVPTKK